MAIKSWFFNSVNGDRRYSADDFGALLNGLINDGIHPSFGDKFQVSPAGYGLNVYSGMGHFNDTFIVNTTVLPLVPDASDLLLPRIDAVVIEINKRQNTRANSIGIITGDPSTNPQRPALMSSGDVWQYPLAYVSIAANASTITTANLTDMRGTEPTMWLTANLPLIDISNAFVKWEGDFENWMEMIKNIGETNDVVALRMELDRIAPKVAQIQTETPPLKEAVDQIKAVLG